MSISSLASDLDSILQHAGVAVTIGVVNSYGVLRKEEIATSDEFQVVGQYITLTVREGTFSGLTQDAAVVADGINYKIREIGKPKTDGSRKLLLVASTP